MDRQMRRAWEAGGKLTMADRVRAKVIDILERHEPEPIPSDVLNRLRAIIAAAEERHRG
jgi:trimethylamine--corrinoid protein Co-methyltransferase